MYCFLHFTFGRSMVFKVMLENFLSQIYVEVSTTLLILIPFPFRTQIKCLNIFIPLTTYCSHRSITRDNIWSIASFEIEKKWHRSVGYLAHDPIWLFQLFKSLFTAKWSKPQRLYFQHVTKDNSNAKSFKKKGSY